MTDEANRISGAGHTQINDTVVGPVARSTRGSIFGHVADLANVFTLMGLLCGVFGIYFAARGNFSAAVISLLWAIFFDWFDGPIARRTKGRTEEFRALGAQLDSLVDIVSSGIGPAMLLLSVGGFSLWFIPGAFALIAAGVLRLSYFNVFGLEDEHTYLGLPIDHNVIIVALVFLLEGQIDRGAFAIVLYVAIVIIAALSVMPFHMPKVGGRWYYAFTAFVVLLTIVFGWRLWSGIT